MEHPEQRVRQPSRVLALAADPSSTITGIRISSPLAPLATDGRIELRIIGWHACRFADLAQCDVVIGQRPVTDRHAWLLRAARARGAAIVVDIDDLLTRPAPHLRDHAGLARHAPSIERGLDEADIVSVSTARLAAALAAGQRHFHVVPNHAWPHAGSAVEGEPVKGADHQPVTVLLASSDAVADGPVFAALQRLQVERGGALRIVAVGPVAEAAKAAGLVVESQALMPRARFLAFAGGLPNAVAVIPLDDSPFSACKSAVKWFDFAQAGLPVLTSARPPYSDVIDDDDSGWLVADDPDAWRHALTRAFDEPGLRARVAQRAAQVVRERHSIDRSTAAWRALLDEIEMARAAGRLRRQALTWPARLLAPWHDLGVSLRSANRERLAQRRRSP